MGGDVTRIEFGDDAPERKQVDAVGKFERERRLLLDQHDRQAFAVQEAERLQDFLGDARREAERGLVEQQQLRPGHQRTAKGEHLLLAAGHGACGLSEPFLQAREQGQHALAPAVEFGLVPQAIGAEFEIVGNGHRGEETAPLRHQHNAARSDRDCIVPRQRLAPETDLAAIGGEPHDRAQQRRLAGSVGAEHGDEFALADVQIDPVQRLDMAIARREAGRGQDRRSSARFYLGRDREAHCTTLTLPASMVASTKGFSVMP
jgi:hypothetical protein